MKNFGVVNSEIRRYFHYSSLQKIGGRALERFSSQKFRFEIFPKTDAISGTFGPGYIHKQSLNIRAIMAKIKLPKNPLSMVIF